MWQSKWYKLRENKIDEPGGSNLHVEAAERAGPVARGQFEMAIELEALISFILEKSHDLYMPLIQLDRCMLSISYFLDLCSLRALTHLVVWVPLKQFPPIAIAIYARKRPS
jgi:hypothetical protein